MHNTIKWYFVRATYEDGSKKESLGTYDYEDALKTLEIHKKVDAIHGKIAKYEIIEKECR